MDAHQAQKILKTARDDAAHANYIVNPRNKFDSFEPGEPLCVFVETMGL